MWRKPSNILSLYQNRPHNTALGGIIHHMSEKRLGEQSGSNDAFSFTESDIRVNTYSLMFSKAVNRQP